MKGLKFPASLPEHVTEALDSLDEDYFKIYVPHRF